MSIPQNEYDPDLIHYFPLSYNGDLSDAVGSGILTPQSTRMTWDATEGKYLLYSYNTTLAAIVSNLSLGQTYGTNLHDLTIFARVKPSLYNLEYITYFNNGYIGFATRRTEGYAGTLVVGVEATIAQTFDGSLRYSYINGISSGTSSTITANSTNDTILNLGAASSSSNGYWYMWDIMMFSRVLTAAEIATL